MAAGTPHLDHYYRRARPRAGAVTLSSFPSRPHSAGGAQKGPASPSALLQALGRARSQSSAVFDLTTTVYARVSTPRPCPQHPDLERHKRNGCVGVKVTPLRAGSPQLCQHGDQHVMQSTSQAIRCSGFSHLHRSAPVVDRGPGARAASVLVRRMDRGEPGLLLWLLIG